MNIELAISIIVLFIVWIGIWMLFFDPNDRTTKLRRERKKAFRKGDYAKGHAINKEFDK
jgi:uncharacterized membrane protein